MKNGKINRVTGNCRKMAVFAHACLLLAICAVGSASAQPVVSYITPDAGARGMTVAVEIIGPTGSMGNFGTDGFYQPGVKVQLQNAGDSTKIIPGPAIVSWDARMVQVMLFIQPNASNASVPLVVANGASVSSAFNFQVVTPQTFGIKFGGGVLGGGLGTRTTRGTMVVDSMVLETGTYTVSTTDIDPSTPGNQAYLPLRILSAGPIKLENATLGVYGANATGSNAGNAGPGGGGGGGGTPSSGGAGFTGGGGVGDIAGTTRRGGAGTGSDTGALYFHGGYSLNGITGGLGTEYNNPGQNNDEGGGGGTAHPFGTSGDHGLYGSNSPAGGYGAGSGGGQGPSGFPFTYATYAGGGGANSGGGGGGGGQGNNAGLITGNAPLIPLAGGSGGASGNVWYSSGDDAGNGGGGGGAVELTTFRDFELPFGGIDAQGGNGSNGSGGYPGNASGGGGGAGGSVAIGARDSISIGNSAQSPSLNVNGGSSGSGYNQGGNGSAGRVRLDGRVSNQNGNANTTNYFTPSRDYVGPNVSYLTTTKTTFVIHGFGKGWTGISDVGNALTVYYRFPSTGWQQASVTTAALGTSRTASWSSATINRTGQPEDSVVYIAALGVDQNAPGASQYVREPQFVMTHTGGMIAHLPGYPLIAVRDTIINFGTERVGKCTKDTSFEVYSVGTALLRVDTAQLSGANPNEFSLQTLDSLRIVQGDSNIELVSFCPKDTGCYSAVLTLNSNDTIKTIILLGCGIQPQIQSLTQIDFGSVPVGSCKDTTIPFTNTGNDTLHVTSQLFGDAHFKLLVPALPYALPPGAKISVTLEYCATDTLGRNSADTVHSDARDSVHLILLTASGKEGILSTIPVIDFGLVDVGSCKDTTISLYNVGNDTLTIATQPNFAANFTMPPGQLPIVIPPHSSKPLTLRFCPTDTNEATSIDSIRPDAPVAGQPLTLLGKGIRGILATPNAIDFGCVVLGTTETRTVVLKNSGVATVSNIAAAATPASELSISQQPGTTLAVLGSDSLTVTFTATTLGTLSGNIHVTSSAASSVDVPVTAKVSVAPQLVLLDTILNFDTVSVGDSLTLCARVMNPSCVPLDLKNVSISSTVNGIFHIGTNAAPQTLSDSVVATLCITFVPKSNGSQSGFATILLDSGNATTGVQLVGVGASPVIEIHPTILDFGDVLVGTTSPALTTEIVNLGISIATIANPTIVGPNAAEFAFTGAPRTLASNDSLQFSFTMTPASVGNKIAYFTVVVAGQLDTITLIGAGVQPGIFVTRQLIDFGNVAVNPLPPPTQTFVIKNTGSAPLTVTSLGFSGISEFTFTSQPAVPATLSSASDSIVVTVTFTPLSVGVKNAQITIDNSTSTTPVVQLTGTGVEAILTVSVDTINFGNVFVGSSKDSVLAITISNTGAGQALTVNSATITGASAGDFKIQVPAPSTLQPGDKRSFDAVFAPSATGLRTATLNIVSDVQNASGTASVFLYGNGVLNAIPVTIFSDTIMSPVGTHVMLPIMTAENLVGSDVTSATVRVNFNPMMLDLEGSHAGSILPAGSTVTLQKYSLGDWAFTITSPTPIAGPGTLVSLDFNLLVAPDALAPVTIASATFGKSAASLGIANQGLIITEACDTSENVQVIASPLTVADGRPNPVSSRALVGVTIREAGHLRLTLFNSIGQQIRVPFDGNVLTGNYSVEINAADLPSGTYHYITEWSAYGEVRRDIKAMIVVK